MNGIVISTGTSKKESLYQYILYDNALQEKEVIDLKSMISEELLREIEEYQSKVCIEQSGQKIAWSTGSGMYVLDMESGQVMTYELKSDGFGEYGYFFCRLYFCDFLIVVFPRRKKENPFFAQFFCLCFV